MNIQKFPSPNFFRGRGTQFPQTPIAIVIHIAAGTMHAVDATFSNPKTQVSAHYCVSRDGQSVHQYVEEHDTAWANGTIHKPSWKYLKAQEINPNAYTISIEHEGKDLSQALPGQLATTAELINGICNRWNIPKDRDHIIGHYEIDSIRRPNCPATDKSIMDKIVELVNSRQ